MLVYELARKYQVRASEWRGDNKAKKVDIKESTNPTHGMKELTADKTSKLTYSENPIINYTSRGLNPEDYIYIEWMETDRDNRGEGYGTLLVEYLINKYPDKTILASANDKSAGLLKKLGVTLI